MGTLTYPVDWWGRYYVGEASPADLAIADTDDKVAFIVQVPKAGTINGVSITTSTVTAAATISVILQTVGADGFPTGTAYKGCVAGTQESPSSNTRYDITFGTPATDVVRGDWIAVVISCPAGSPNLRIKCISQNTDGDPRVALYTAAWAHSNGWPILSLAYSDGTCPYCGCAPTAATLTSAFGTDSTPDEVGNSWTEGAEAGRVLTGVWCYGDLDGPGSFVVYNAAGDSIATLAFDPDYRASIAARRLRFIFDTEVNLTAGATYRVTFLPSSSTTVTLYEWVATEAILQGTPCGGALKKCSRSNAGEWTADATRQVLIGPTFSGVVIPSSGWVVRG